MQREKGRTQTGEKAVAVRGVVFASARMNVQLRPEHLRRKEEEIEGIFFRF